MNFVELLAPARDLQSAVAAVDYGADAVYIGHIIIPLFIFFNTFLKF